MDWWMFKREIDGFPNPDTMMNGGVMFKSEYYCH